MKALKILRSARRDLAAGSGFYEDQETGIGEYFIASLREQIEVLKKTGGTHRIASIIANSIDWFATLFLPSLIQRPENVSNRLCVSTLPRSPTAFTSEPARHRVAGIQ
jgi:hypothetical protein